jgi:two-component system, LytTR family, response regulator
MKTILSSGLSNKLTAMIVDDELHGRENLRMIIETYCSEIEVIGLAESVVGAKELVLKLKPDVVFLDINMPVLDGFDFLDEFVVRDFKVVFVSAHEEFGIRALKAGATDYLLKPIDIKDLKQTVKKLLILPARSLQVEKQHNADKLIVPSTHGFEVLDIDKIIRLEADGCYTTLFLKDSKSKVISRTLKDFEETLADEIFFRVHKSHLINLKYIRDYSNFSGSFVTMTDGSRIEISRRKAPDFIQKMKALLKNL